MGWLQVSRLLFGMLSLKFISLSVICLNDCVFRGLSTPLGPNMTVDPDI